MGQRITPESLLSQVNDLERRIRDLASFPQLTNATIRDGALRVRDDSLLERVILGKLADGSFGLSILDASGDSVLAETLGFGPRGDFTSTSQSRSSTSYGNLGTAGPDVSVDIGPTGRMIVVVGARVVPGETGEGLMSYAVSGATTVAASDDNAIAVEFNPGQMSFASVQTGLNEGSHTVQAKYRSEDGTSKSFSNRSLVVWPF